MTESAYFETPERAERAQLLIHLINNAQDVIYLRGPRGAGKTRFMRQLLPSLEPDYEINWRSGAGGSSIESASSMPTQRPLAGGDAELDLLIQAQMERPTLRIIDDADALGQAELEELKSFDPSRERIVLLGNGGPTLGLGDLHLQCVDLPAFTEVQSREFLRMQAGGSERVPEETLVASLHRAAGGQPGPLLDALASLPSPGIQAEKGAKPPQARRLLPNWRLIGITGALVLLLVSVLLFQDRINALFVSSEEAAQVAVDEPSGVHEVLPETVEPAEGEDGLAAGAEPDPESAGPAEMPDGDFQSLVQPLPASESAPAEHAEASTAEASDAGLEAPGDPILDAVIDAAIQAAEQPPEVPADVAARTESAVAAAPVDHLASSRSEVPAGSEQAAAVPVKSQVTEKPPRPDKKAPKAARSDTGLGWLRSRSPGRYTLQLVGSRDRASIDRFIRKHGIARPYAVFARDLGGQPWYSLVAGDHPDRESALAARRELPKALSGVWPRTFGSIQQQLTER